MNGGIELREEWSRGVLCAATVILACSGAAAGHVEFFQGSATVDGAGEENVAFEAWDSAIGRPVRQIYFDDIQFPGSSILLSDVQADDWGTVNTSLGSFFAVKTGGDVGLFPLFSDWDNLVLRQEGTDFHGVSNVNDLTEPNANLLGPSTNQVVQINFGEGIDLGDGTIANFGLVEAVGAFVSTEGNVTLSIFDVDGLLISEISTPGSIGAFSPPYFLGIVLPPDNGVKQEIISRAVFSFDSVAALDGLVYTSVVDAQPPFVIPEPSTLGLVGIGLAGLAGLRRRKNK